MTKCFNNKNIILGMTGSVAAYKSPDIVRRLRELGSEVRVVMTENAKRFVTPLTMQAVSGRPIHEELFDLHAEAAMGHIELARWADLILVAPASADFMGRLATGHANDLLSTLCLATDAPIAIAPAMNQRMWHNVFCQNNVKLLTEQKIHILGPMSGHQACGDIGFGRMMEPLDIIEQAAKLLKTGLLDGMHVLITAGPTREPIDPVRFISNRSSGKMGYALAEAASLAGAKVSLISGPTHLQAPTDVELISIQTAEQMLEAVMRKITQYDILIAVAAVSDYRTTTIATQKIQKQQGLTLNLEQTPDIVTAVGQMPDRPFVVGFAAETHDVINRATAKRLRKGMDIIIANLVGDGIGMESDDNELIYISSNATHNLARNRKTKLAQQLITLIAKDFQPRKGTQVNER